MERRRLKMVFGWKSWELRLVSGEVVALSQLMRVVISENFSSVTFSESHSNELIEDKRVVTDGYRWRIGALRRGELNWVSRTLRQLGQTKRWCGFNNPLRPGKDVSSCCIAWQQNFLMRQQICQMLLEHPVLMAQARKWSTGDAQHSDDETMVEHSMDADCDRQWLRRVRRNDLLWESDEDGKIVKRLWLAQSVLTIQSVWEM